MKRSKKKDALPEWLKSTHQELNDGMTATESPRVAPRAIYESETRAKYAAEALLLLGVKEKDLEASPRIEHLFRDIGGQAKVFEYLSGSEEPEARKVLELRSRLNDKQAYYVPFEAYCIAAVIPVKRMFGLISSECMSQEAMAKRLLFQARHTEVVKATIESALDPLGHQDRKMLHQADGFVPVPKSASITYVRGNQITDSSNNVQNIAVLPPVEDTVRRLGDRFNDRVIDVKALPAPEVTIPADDDEEDDGDDE